MSSCPGTGPAYAHLSAPVVHWFCCGSLKSGQDSRRHGFMRRYYAAWCASMVEGGMQDASLVGAPTPYHQYHLAGAYDMTPF
eukprot:1140747-Pelagomonas_calceolata.AAC.3